MLRVTFYVHRGSGQAHPRRWLSLSSRAKAFTLRGRHRQTFRRRFRLPYVAPRSSPPCWRTAKWYHQILQKVQNLMPHDCIPSCTVDTVVQQYALIDYYCCFHLTSGTSTAAGPSIVHRNRKRFLLSQSTLREEFVEKKYQVFDIIGLLTILVQVNLSSPVERV